MRNVTADAVIATLALRPHPEGGHYRETFRDSAARSLGDWTLVGCTVAPGFRFEGFEWGPEDWSV